MKTNQVHFYHNIGYRLLSAARECTKVAEQLIDVDENTPIKHATMKCCEVNKATIEARDLLTAGMLTKSGANVAAVLLGTIGIVSAVAAIHASPFAAFFGIIGFLGIAIARYIAQCTSKVK